MRGPTAFWVCATPQKTRCNGAIDGRSQAADGLGARVCPGLRARDKRAGACANASSVPRFSANTKRALSGIHRIFATCITLTCYHRPCCEAQVGSVKVQDKAAISIATQASPKIKCQVYKMQRMRKAAPEHAPGTPHHRCGDGMGSLPLDFFVNATDNTTITHSGTRGCATYLTTPPMDIMKEKAVRPCGGDKGLSNGPSLLPTHRYGSRGFSCLPPCPWPSLLSPAPHSAPLRSRPRKQCMGRARERLLIAFATAADSDAPPRRRSGRCRSGDPGKPRYP